MTQPSNHDAYAPWGEPTHVQTGDPWTRLVSRSALVQHVVWMVTVLAVIVAFNLLITPGTFWGLIPLIVWLVILVLHGLASLALAFLRDDAQGRPAVSPSTANQPEADGSSSGASFPSWGFGRRKQEEGDAPSSWALSDDVSGNWPEPPVPGRKRDQAESSHDADADDVAAPETNEEEAGSWKTVTDIAWRRRGSASRKDDGASSSSDATRSDEQ